MSSTAVSRSNQIEREPRRPTNAYPTSGKAQSGRPIAAYPASYKVQPSRTPTTYPPSGQVQPGGPITVHPSSGKARTIGPVTGHSIPGSGPPSRPQHVEYRVPPAGNAPPPRPSKAPTISSSGASGGQDVVSQKYSSWDWVIHIGPITIRIRFWCGPKQDITDKALFALGIEASAVLSCTDSPLPNGYRRKYSEFFSAGLVFAVPRPENVETSGTIASAGPTPDAHKEQLFVVLGTGNGFCSVLAVNTFPDDTYRSYGSQLKGIIPSEQGVLCADDALPRLLLGEEETQLQPLRIKLYDRDFRLRSASRINYGQVFSVRFDVPVRAIGRLNKESISLLSYNLRCVWNRINHNSAQGNIALLREATQPDPRRDSGIETSSGSRAQRNSVQTDAHRTGEAGVTRSQLDSRQSTGEQAVKTGLGQPRHSMTRGATDKREASLTVQMQALSLRAQNLGADISMLPSESQQHLAEGSVDQQVSYLLRVLQTQNPARHTDMVRRRQQNHPQRVEEQRKAAQRGGIIEIDGDSEEEEDDSGSHESDDDDG